VAEPAGPEAPRGRRGSLRLRITAAAVLAVAVTLGAFTLVFALVQRAVLDDGPRSAASSDVSRVVAALEAGTSPAAAVAGDADGSLVVVLDARGAVVAAGGDDDLVAEAARLADARGGDRVQLDDEPFVAERDDASVTSGSSAAPEAAPSPSPSPSSSGDDDDDDDQDRPGRGGSDGSSASDGDDGSSSSTSDDDADDAADLTVVAARSLEEAQAASAASLVTLGVAVPVALLVLGVTTWFVVGRALRPVEAMRREVDEVTAARLDRRLRDPGGRDEIARLARTLNGMLDRLDASARAQRRFVGDASHELKTPLATIRQHAEVAMLHPGSIDGPALAGTVLGEEARLTALVQGLLVLARADEGALGAARRPVDLDDLVVSETSRLRASSGLRVDASGVGPARVEGDEPLLGQVVRNLVANAARHAASQVSLGLVERDGRAVLTVDDDGGGVPVADRGRVFERFVRLDEARDRDAGGSGLGLAIVAEIVRVHGGSVQVDDSPLGGARFVVDLPAA